MEHIDNLENNNWNLNIEDINENIEQIKKNNNFEPFNYQNYLDLNYEDLKKIKEENENQDLKDYLDNILKNMEKDKTIYSNSCLLNELYKKNIQLKYYLIFQK